MTTITRRVLLGSAAAAPAALVLPRSTLAAWPERPIRVIVPTQPGGGMDSTARLLQRAFEERKLLPHNFVVVNMDGAGGTIGTRAVRDAAPDGYTIGYWHEGIVTSKVMGITDYDHTAFELLGSTGYETLGFGVRAEGPIKTLEDLIAMAKAQPGRIKNATNVGLPVHFYPLIFQSLVGAEFRYVQTGGGARRMPSVAGGHTDFSIFGTNEFLTFKEAGIRPIVIFGPERSRVLPDVPTARERGIDMLALAYRIWLMPKGTPAEITGRFTDALRTAMADPDIVKAFEDQGLVARFIEPAEVVKELDVMRERATPLVPKARELQQG